MFVQFTTFLRAKYGDVCVIKVHSKVTIRRTRPHTNTDFNRVTCFGNIIVFTFAIIFKASTIQILPR